MSAHRRINVVAADVGGSPEIRPSSSSTFVVGRYGGTVVVTLHGDIDQAASVRLAGVLGDIIDGQGNLAVVVDLHDVGWIVSAGVDVLAAAAARIASHRGELLLGGPTGVVFDAIATAGLAGLLSPIEQEHRPLSGSTRERGVIPSESRARGCSSPSPRSWGLRGNAAKVAKNPASNRC